LRSWQFSLGKMFKKLGRALGGGGKGSSLRVKFDLEVVQVDNLPQAVRKCRVVWSRSAKVQMTNIKDVRGGAAQFKQTLTQVTSIHKDKNGEYEAKEYVVKVQVPQGVAGDNIITIGKANINLARYVGDESNTQKDVLPIAIKVGHSTTGYIKFTITATHLGESGDDGMTEVSGLTGLTSEGGDLPDQDLDGFDDPSPAKGRKGASPDTASSKAKASSKRPSALPTTREEAESDLEEEDSRKKLSKSASKSRGGGADEIQPLRPTKAKGSSSGPDFGKRTGSGRQAAPAARPTWDEDISSVESDLDEDDMPDARPPPKGGARKSEKKPKKGLMGLMKRDDSEEDEPEPPPPPPKPKEPEADLQDLKSDLFGKKKDPSKAAADKPGTSRGGASTSKAAAVELDEDSARNALFSAPAKKAPRAKEAPAPPPPAAEEDEDALRNALFAAPKKDKSAGGGKSSKAAAAPPPPPPEDDEDALRGALFAAPAKAKGAKASKKDAPADELGFGDEPAFGGSSRKASGGKASGTGRNQDEDLGFEDNAFAKAAKKGAAAGGNGNMQQEVEMLRSQLQQAQQREEKLKRQVQELEDKLAEVDVDPAEMYAQMQELENKHRAELKKLHEESQFQIEELEAELEELRSAAPGAGSKGGAKAADLDAREADVTRMEEEVKAKMVEANRMVDESMLLAVKNQQERRALQDQVDKLKQQLEDRGRSSMAGSEAEEVMADLRQQVEALQKENEDLKKSASSGKGALARGAAAGASAASIRKSQRSTPLDSEDEDSAPTTSLAASRAQKRELERAQAEVTELRAKCEKLEAICEDLEAHAADERADLEHQLEAACAEIATLRASAGTSGIRKAEDALAGSDSSTLQSKVSELEQRSARMARENTRLAGLLEDERGEREHLEELVKRGLSDMGDDEAVEAVEAFEVKYARLKERYKQLEIAAGEEADDLAAQLADAQAEVEQLRRAGAAPAAAAARGAGGASASELASLREENERLVQQLVSKQMEFAMLSEEQAMLKRDLYRAKEVNMKLAAKMTKLEAQAYSGKGRKDDKKKAKDESEDEEDEE